MISSSFIHFYNNRQQGSTQYLLRCGPKISNSCHTNLEDQRHQLLQAHYAGAVPLDLLKDEQERLASELATIQRRLDSYHADATLVRQHLTQALDLLEDCHRSEEHTSELQSQY